MENIVKQRLPIGLSDFEEIITQNYYFVDKSLFIKEIIDNKAKVTLLPRPRRFGKTLNLSMVNYFFEKHPDLESKKHLFNNLNISKHKNVMYLQGKSPVIFLTFKDIKVLTWENCYEHLKMNIGDEFRRHSYLLKSNILDENQKTDFKQIITYKASISLYENSIKTLTHHLYRYYKQKVVLLIDEYDTPIHAGYIYKYYDQIISFMRTFLSSGLKDNINLDFSIITGILRVAKESIFSGLNNLEVMTFLDKNYSDKFGFTQQEAEKLLSAYSKEDGAKIIKDAQNWYNGYNFGENKIYNPWSILNFAKRKEFAPYWVNTSSNDIIKKIMKTGNKFFKKNMQELIEGKSIDKHINDNIVFADIDKKLDTLWSFLLFSGYLTYSNKRIVRNHVFCELSIPNREVAYVFEDIIMGWIEQGVHLDDYEQMLKALVEGDIEEFKLYFEQMTARSLSYFDPVGDEPELFYHALVLGMLVSLNSTHMIKSNRESGFGRYDVMIIPRDKSKLGIIIEFKQLHDRIDKTLEIAASNALQQIDKKQYELEMRDMGITNIIKLAIAFKGKDALVVTNNKDEINSTS